MIRHGTAAEAFSAAASAMAADRDVVDIAASLLLDCTALLPAASAAILVTSGGGRLSLLHASSHKADEIEMLQVQSDSGPCVEAIASGRIVSESGREAIVERWGPVGEAIVRAGYAHVSAIPMRWHDRVLGGFNVFRTDPNPLSDLDHQVAEGFTNMATLALVRPSDIPIERLTARVAEAIQSRSVIEQAKGVLAERHQVDVGAAYELLIEMVLDRDDSIIAASEQIVGDL